MAPRSSLLQNPSLKTKLLLMMLSLLLLSISTLFFLHLYSERQLLSHVREYTDDLSRAIEIAQQQPPAAEVSLQAALEAYKQSLQHLGVRELSIIGPANEVQASTNPANVGKHVRVQKRTEYIVTGVLGDETAPPGVQRTSTFRIPIIVNDKRVGSLELKRNLEDFSALSNSAFLSRLLATLGIFAFGIMVSLYLSWSFSQPLQKLTRAARQVAAGDLQVRVGYSGRDEIGGLSKTFNEMVERLRENRLLEERLHFAERSTAMGRLASAVAHEIRNPLNFINLSIDHVRERLGPEDKGRREDFDRILHNVKAEISRLNRLVGDFLSFGKPMRLSPRPCAIDEVVRDVASLVDHKARDQGIALHVESAEGLPRVIADPELLKTCFLNLMINAVDAMPGGGLLTLSVQRGQNLGVEVMVITLTDTGQGMSPEDIRTAFEPYFSTKDTGIGLGLALTRKIVEDHGGSITLESEPGCGTTARIVLPLAPQGSEAKPKEAVLS